jgi:magnesium transporter
MRALEHCAQGFAAARPDDAARLVEQYPTPEAAAFLASLPSEVAAGVVSRMAPAAGAVSLAAMATERGSAVLAALAPLPAAALLRRLPADTQERMMTEVGDDARTALRRLVAAPDDTVGSLADPTALALPDDVTVATALQQLRRHHRVAHHHVYVVDRDRTLVGVVHVRDLLAGKSRQPLASLVRPARATLLATSRLAGAAAHPAWRDVDALPVTDTAGRLVGMVRYRQLRDYEAMPGPGRAVDTVVSFGELLWVGLALFLPGLTAGSPAAPSQAAATQGGAHHG